MHILVTGGAGFIGSHLCKKLLEMGHRVTCVDNLLTGSETNIQELKNNENFAFIKHDIIEPLSHETHIDMIFHLASPASPNHHSAISYHALPMETMMVNTQGTHNALEFAQKHNAVFLFASTSEIYGDPLEHPQKEDYRGNTSTTGPRSVYDEAKRFGETLVAYYGRDKKLDVRISRIFNTYGPMMRLDDKRMIISFIESALQNNPIPVFGDGTQTRSLCYVDDTVDGLIKHAFTKDASGTIINIGSPEEHTVEEYAQKVIALTESKSKIEKTEALPQDDPKQRRPDISRAKQLLGWEPKTSLEAGLSHLITYIRAQIDKK